MKRGMMYVFLVWSGLVFVLFLGAGCVTQNAQERDRVVSAQKSSIEAAAQTMDKPKEKTAVADVIDQAHEAPVEKAANATEPSIPSGLNPEFAPPKPDQGALFDKTQDEAPPEKVEAGGITLNFDDTDLYEVIRTLADLLNINYIVDPSVRGKVTIHATRGLKREDLLPVFLQILEVNNLTAIKEGNLYKIIPIKDASRMPITPRFGRDGEEITPGEKFIMQIIPLKFISAQEMAKLLANFISANGTIVPETNTNTLLLVDKGTNVLKALRLVDAFDIDVFEKVYHRFFHLINSDVEEVVTILGDAFSSYATVLNADLKFISISRLNILLVISSNPLIFNKVEEFIHQIDVAMEDVEPRIYVYFVKNGEAKQLAGLLDDVFPKKSTTKTDTAKTQKKDETQTQSTLFRNPLSQAAKEQKKTEAAQETKEAAPKKVVAIQGQESGGAGTLRGEVNITSDEVRNALIIEATPADYRTIMDMLEQIDILPRQVLIEATIAEITLKNQSDLGVEWFLGKGAAIGEAEGITHHHQISVGAGGLFYTLGEVDEWYAALNALASQNRVNILSSPHILASDNKEAKIDVSREIPVASSEYVYGDNVGTTQTSIEYRDTGVILTVTPHINDRGLVTMELSQEVSEVEEEATVVGNKSYPSFLKRTVTTTLTVGHGQTIVIGGLIQDKDEDLKQGVPFLSRIPLLGFVFGKKSRNTTKAELIIMITPRVITTQDDVHQVTEEFKLKVSDVVEIFRRNKDYIISK